MGRRGLLATLVVLPARVLAANPDPFSFVVPEGFVDITHETKPPLGVIDDEFYERAKTLDFLAVKVMDGVAVAAVGASVATGRAPSNLGGGAPGMKVLAISKLRLAGLDCGRVESERADGVKVVTLVLPGLERWAQLELSVFDLDRYAGLVAAFEAAAARTTGIGLPAPPADPPAPLFFLLGVAALVGIVVGKLIHGRKRSTAWRKSRKS
jgi:hypothetical protein